eukprot:scaffold180623_cov20-Tisochrysis_lutea.AAC.1
MGAIRAWICACLKQGDIDLCTPVALRVYVLVQQFFSSLYRQLRDGGPSGFLENQRCVRCVSTSLFLSFTSSTTPVQGASSAETTR